MLYVCMEEENNKKRKKLCDLELNKLVDTQGDDDEEPPCLVVTNNGDDVKLMSDLELEQSIIKYTNMYQGLATKLRDGGRKLKERISILHNEKESREHNNRIVKVYKHFYYINMFACNVC